MRCSSSIILGAVFLLCQPAAAQSAKKHYKDSVLIAGKMKTFISDFNNLNWESFHADFDEDISAFLESDTLTLVEGRKGVEQLFKSLFDNVRQHAPGPPYLHIVPENFLVQVDGSTAVVTFHMTRRNAIVRRAFVWTKRNGAWRIIHINGSTVDFPKK